MRVGAVDDERGRRVAVKFADSLEEAARLRREADLLEIATHPGLVELVSLDDGTQTVLRTAWIDGVSLAEGSPLDVEEVAGVVAAVASTLADLHALGVVHGAVVPEHVIVDGDGRPVLCGLGYGGLVGERPPTQSPPGAEPGELLEPAADVAGLGAVLSFLLAQANGRVRGASGEALRRLAERAASSDPGRPPARELADAIHDAVGGARLPRRAPAAMPPLPSGRADPLKAPTRQKPLDGWRRSQVRPPLAGKRPLRFVGAGLLAAAAVGGALLAAGGSPAAGPPRAAPVVTSAVPPVATGPTSSEPAPSTSAAVTTSPTTAAPVPPRPARAGCPPVDGPLSADVDGDGCAEVVRFTGGVIEAGPHRWAVGDPGDVVAVGDWTCAGSGSLAVLRPTTGEVFAFSGWAAPEQGLAAPLIGSVPGGQALRAADLDADGCNELVVERATGAAVLHPPRGPR